MRTDLLGTTRKPSNSSGILQTAPPGSLILQLASGRTSAYSLPGDKSRSGSSFFLHVPTSHPVSRRARQEPPSDSEALPRRVFPLLVVVHGSRRDAEKARDRWSDFSEKHQLVVLCPLFPADLGVVNGIHNYKLIRYHDTNYGELLLQLVAHVIREWGDIDYGPFNLSGFSGGAQFAHRFWYLYPDHIASLAIVAPGAATLLDPTLQWPRGIQDEAVELTRLRRARVTVVVGDQDAGTGYSRIEVARSLRKSLNSADIDIDEVTLVTGAGHEEWKLQATLEQWFESCMGL